MHIQELTLNTNILSLGSLLGTNGQQELLNNINSRYGGGSFFGSVSDPFREGFQNYMHQVVEPIRAVKNILHNTVNALMNPDVARAIDSISELERGIPPCMQLPIIYTPIIRQLLEEERIDGFGIDPKTLREDDPYACPLKNGYVELHSSNLGKNGEYEIVFCHDTSAPELSDEEIQAIRSTREYIERFYHEEATRNMDFTSYPDLRC